MKELDFLKIINKKLSDNSYLGDDCAFLKELGLFITQDTLVENVHFKLEWTTPSQLAKKAIAVNLSDLAASACKPKYITISLSIPKYIDNNFIEQFYDGINEECLKYDIKVIGGDITGSEALYISICAIGEKIYPNITSRSFASHGDIIITTGNFGSSAAGLHLLQNNLKEPSQFIKHHLSPTPKINEALKINEVSTKNVAAMDTSDGLVDALFKISSASNITMEVDFAKIPIDAELQNHFTNYKSLALTGGEDYELVVCVDKPTYERCDKTKFTKIGSVIEKISNTNVIIHDRNNLIKITPDNFDNFTYDHFKEQ